MRDRTYRAVSRYFARQGAVGTLLDAPCGRGHLSSQLLRHGFDVVSADISSTIVDEPNLNFLQVDLNMKLPFADGTFDYIASVEGIEHLENPFHAVRELRRIIKTDGKLVITTPNIQSIGSRFRFFMTGGFNYFQRPYYRAHMRHGLYGHINPISLYEMMFILTDANFKIEKVFTDAGRFGSFLFAPVWPLVSLSTIYFVCLRERNAPQRRENLRMFRYMASPSVIFGRIMIIAARAV